MYASQSSSGRWGRSSASTLAVEPSSTSAKRSTAARRGADDSSENGLSGEVAPPRS